LRRGPPSSCIPSLRPATPQAPYHTMSSPRLVTRSLRAWRDPNPCVFCSSLQIASNVRNGAAERSTSHGARTRSTGYVTSTRAYATAPGLKFDAKRYRVDVDERARIGFYTMNKMQGVLLMDPSKANSIAKEFLAKQKTMDNVRNIKHLASSVFT
jgi:hypothetical protein